MPRCRRTHTHTATALLCIPTHVLPGALCIYAQEMAAQEASMRNQELQGQLQQQAAKTEALERQLMRLQQHAPCGERDVRAGASRGLGGGGDGGGECADGADGSWSDTRQGSASGASAASHEPSSIPGGRARAEAAPAGARGHESAPSAIGSIARLAMLSVPNMKRRADGSWAESEEGAGVKRLRRPGGVEGGA